MNHKIIPKHFYWIHKIENTTSEQIGDSFEGREINVFKINANNKDLPAVIMDAGTEYRESRILLFMFF